MTRKTIIILSISLFGTIAYSQNNQWGLSLNSGVSQVVHESTFEFMNRLTSNEVVFTSEIGGFYDFEITDNSRVQLKLLYSCIGGDLLFEAIGIDSQPNGDQFEVPISNVTKWRLSYLTIPVTYNYAFNRFTVLAGGEYSILVGSQVEQKGQISPGVDVDYSGDFLGKNNNVLVNFGFAYQLTAKVQFGLKYSQGLVNISTRKDVQLITRDLQFTTNYTFSR